MTRKEIKHISSRQYRKLKNRIDSIAEGMTPEAIHKFRVEYKKLRAFFRSLSSLRSTPTNIRMPRTLKQLYSICGKIRDLQLQQERIKALAGSKERGSDAYINTLQRAIDDLKPQLKKMLSKKLTAQGKQKTDKRLPDDFSQDDLAYYIQTQWTGITTTIHQAKLNDDSFHSIRKYFKDLSYAGRFYKKDDSKLNDQDAPKDTDEQFLSGLQERLGEFQDQHVSICCLDKYWLNRFKVATHQFLDRVQSGLLKDHQVLRRSLKKEILGYIKLHKTSIEKEISQAIA